MIVMIANDFYSEYELYRTDDLEGLKKVTMDYVTSGNADLDPNKYEYLGSQDDTWLEDAQKMADTILFASDFMIDEAV